MSDAKRLMKVLLQLYSADFEHDTVQMHCRFPWCFKFELMFCRNKFFIHCVIQSNIFIKTTALLSLSSHSFNHSHVDSGDVCLGLFYSLPSP